MGGVLLVYLFVHGTSGFHIGFFAGGGGGGGGGGGHMATHASPTPSHSLGTSYHTQGCDQLTCSDLGTY